MATANASPTHSGIIADLMRRIAQNELLHQVLTDEINATPDPAVRLAYENRARLVRDQIDSLNAEIQQRRRASPDPGVSERAWREKLPEIDFKAPIEVFKTVLGKMPHDCGAALFLMQDGIASAASLCVARMIAEVRRTVDLDLPLRFSGAIPSPRELMQKLAGYLNLAADLDAEALAAAIVSTIVDSLIPGRIVWLGLECDSAVNSAEFLGWFLEKLWCPLVQALPGRKKNARFAQVFAIVTYNVPMDTCRLRADWFCEPDRFEAQRFVRVPLERAWKPGDISDWMFQFTEAPRCAGIDIDAEAQSIYEMCREGVPEMVLRQIDRFMARTLAPAACGM